MSSQAIIAQVKTRTDAEFGEALLQSGDLAVEKQGQPKNQSRLRRLMNIFFCCRKGDETTDRFKRQSSGPFTATTQRRQNAMFIARLFRRKGSDSPTGATKSSTASTPAEQEQEKPQRSSSTSSQTTIVSGDFLVSDYTCKFASLPDTSGNDVLTYDYAVGTACDAAQATPTNMFSASGLTDVFAADEMPLFLNYVLAAEDGRL